MPQRFRVHIRWMIRRDMAEVLAIEKDSFPTPWDHDDFIGVLRMRNCIGLVVEYGDKIVGYMLYELHDKYIDVLNFAVDPAYRRCGVGTAMVNKLIGKLSSHKRTRFRLHIRESNLVAQLFFRKMGLVASKVLRRYYPDTSEDAYRMRYTINSQIGVSEDSV